MPPAQGKMTVILRLQGLDVKASTEDIRSFFKSLHIPDGGVYILGGSLKEAFIAFSTEKDAQLAMCQTGNALKGRPVTLHMSNMAEMEQRLNSYLKKTSQSHSAANFTSSPCEDSAGNVSSSDASPIDPADLSILNDQHAGLKSPIVPDLNAQSVDSSTAFLLGMCTVLQSLKSSDTAGPGVYIHKVDNSVLSEEKTPERTLNLKPGYVRLFGLPASTTKEDICHFFKGLTVQEVIVNAELGVSRGCLVKFAKMQDAFDALHYNEQSLGSIRVEVRGADEKLWTGVLQECGNDSGVQVTEKPKQHGLKESANKRDSDSMPQLKRQTSDQFPLKPSKRPKPDVSKTSLSPTRDYTVMVKNIPKNTTKTELKELFRCPNIPHKNVVHLLDRHGNRTDKAFLLFNCSEDFDYAMNLSGCHVGSGAIEVSSIRREIMNEMLLKRHCNDPGLRDPRIFRRRKFVSAETEAPPSSNLDLAQVCIFVRNMPANVQKSKIKGLFRKYEVEMDDIVLLYDSTGNGTGEAVVKFASEQLAAQAHLIHGREFLGTKVLLTRINMKQMKDILVNT